MGNPLAIVSTHVRNGQYDRAHNEEPLTGWRALPELPSSNELMAMEQPILLENDVTIPPSSKITYLETQYRLYRCEAIKPLRRAISIYKRDASMMEDEEVSIYTQVHVKGYLLSKQGPVCRIDFSTERSQSRVLWGKSDRLKPGQLVVLSSDGFRRECLVATVADRRLVGGLLPNIASGEDDNTPPRIDLLWANPKEAIINPTTSMVMLEAKIGFFESLRYSMTGLQHAARYESRFDKYIIKASTSTETANYLGQEPHNTISPAAGNLDASQKQAFDCMTSQEFSIVQGPPGTGKTFTSTVAIQSLTRALRGKGPIIVTAETNHALDQLLEHCLRCQAGEVVRIGGRYNSDLLEEYSLFNIRQKSKKRKTDTASEVSRKQVTYQIQAKIKSCFDNGLISAADLYQRSLISKEQYESLVDNSWESVDQVDEDIGTIKAWLGQCVQEEPADIYRPPQHQIEPPTRGLSVHEDDNTSNPEDRYHLEGDYIPIEFSSTGVIHRSLQPTAWYQAERYLKTCADLYQIRPAERGIVYRCLRRKMIDIVSEELRGLLVTYCEVCMDLKVSKWCNDIQVLQHKGVQIIGCTTTGLTKYRGLLAGMEPRVLLVEEAAQVCEPSLTSALLPSLEQVILVGDHQQLRPSVDDAHVAAAPYNLRISLFERLVGIGVPYTTLRIQRRMIPALREVVQQFYPSLEDHETVLSPTHRPPVPGMGGRNLWWFHHEWVEQRHWPSYSNGDEADMIVGFVGYLLANGVRLERVTVLTYYRPQVELIRRKLSQTLGKECAVSTVDGFQGQENDIIILSLVRSPHPGAKAAVGFVADTNRAVVATSRARCGFYIFGNIFNIVNGSQVNRSSSFSEKSNPWDTILSTVRNRASDKLPVTCKSHGTVTTIRTPNDWSLVISGGCGKPCNNKCPNNHQCRKTCHAIDQEHTTTCYEKCPRTLACGHGCAARCQDKCRCALSCTGGAKSSPMRQTNSSPNETSNHENISRKGAFNTDYHVKSGFRQHYGELAQLSPKGVELNGLALRQPTSQMAQQSPSLRIKETYRRTETTTSGQRIIIKVPVHTEIVDFQQTNATGSAEAKNPLQPLIQFD